MSVSTPSSRSRIPSAEGDHPIHIAAERGDLRRVRALAAADPALVHRGDRAGGTALHRAVIGRAPRVVALLLDLGSDIHAIHGDGPGSAAGYAPVDLQPIDLAIWGGPCQVPSVRVFVAGVRDALHERFAHSRRVHDLASARLLIARGADHDLPTAAALGDIDRVTALLDESPARISEARPNSRRALSAGVEFGHERIVHLLLERGADPTWPDADDSPRGPPFMPPRALVLRLLLARGGLNPDYPTPEGVTLLHALCNRDERGRTMRHREECAAILLEAGADISARDARHQATPLEWATRNNLPDMIEFLRKNGAS